MNLHPSTNNGMTSAPATIAAVVEGNRRLLSVAEGGIGFLSLPGGESKRKKTGKPEGLPIRQ